MGWQLYFCIPSYKSNSLEETTAVSSWSQYDSNKEAFLVTSKQEGEGKVKHKMPTITYLEDGMGMFGFVCAILCIWLWGAVSCLWSWMIMVYLWQISQNSKNSDLCVAAEGFCFLPHRTGLLAGVHVRAEMTWDQPARGSPWINNWCTPRLVNATYRCLRCHLQRKTWEMEMDESQNSCDCWCLLHPKCA